MDNFKIMIVLVLGIIGIAVQNIFLMQEITSIDTENTGYATEISSLESKIETAQKEYEGHIEDIYFLMKSDSSRLYTIMDTEVRILHYAKPHKHPMWACPECAEQMQRGKKNDVPSRSQHEKSEAEAGD